MPVGVRATKIKPTTVKDAQHGFVTVATVDLTPSAACVNISTSAADDDVRTHLLLNTVKRFSIKHPPHVYR